MPRATPDWNWQKTPSGFDTPLSDDVAIKVANVVSFASDEAIEHFLYLSETRVQHFITMMRAIPNFPSPRQELEAANSLKKDANSLARKLRSRIGGSEAGIHDAMLAIGLTEDEYGPEADFYLNDLVKRMEVLSALADEMQKSAREEMAKPATRYDIQRQLAEDIADAYATAIGEMPKASVQREYGKAHPYVRVLHLLYDFATGKNHELSTIEHIARKAFR